jgi:hypothetical protein
MLVNLIAQRFKVTIAANMAVANCAISSDRFLQGDFANSTPLHAR